MRRKWICAAGLIVLAGVVACGAGTPDDEATSAGSGPSTHIGFPTNTGTSGSPDGDGTTDDGSPTDTATSTSPRGVGTTDDGSATDTTTTSGSADDPDVLLAQQITVIAAGDGARIDCRGNLDVQPAQHPDVWISSAYIDAPFDDHRAVTYLIRESGLCLFGFSDKQSIKIHVRVGTAVFDTTVVPTATTPPPEFPEYEAPETLLRGGTLTVQHPPVFDGQSPEPDPVLQSGMWWFLPPLKIRDAMAETGSLQISAAQAGRTASRTQHVVLPTSPDRIWLDHEAYELAVFGFAPGQVIPVGLYKLTGEFDGPGETATLVGDSIGTVKMPPSRVAVFKVPADVVTSVAGGAVEYCITVPLETQYNCPPL
jgi:hypothetical protein